MLLRSRICLTFRRIDDFNHAPCSDSLVFCFSIDFAFVPDEGLSWLRLLIAVFLIPSAPGEIVDPSCKSLRVVLCDIHVVEVDSKVKHRVYVVFTIEEWQRKDKSGVLTAGIFNG